MNTRAEVTRTKPAGPADSGSIDQWLLSAELRAESGPLDDDRLRELLYSVEQGCRSSGRGVAIPHCGLTRAQRDRARRVAARDLAARGGRFRLGRVDWVSDDGESLRVELPR